MNGFLNSSALVPVFYGDHVNHQPSLARFLSLDRSSGCCGAHSLVEVYSTLTRMPGIHRASSEQALLFLGDIRARLTVIALGSEEYFEALRSASARGIVGGSIYDAMLAQCALKAGADVIYTWNIRHYALCGPEVATRLQTP